ncbi:MAG: lyase family protein, partial [Acidimicrobiia bacterium]
MIPRYSISPMKDLFTDEAKFAAWLEVEILAVEAWAELGVVPAADAAAIRARAGFDVAEIEARERVTNHDVAAFVDMVAGRVGEPAGKWVHYGLTSSDVVDTALSLTLTRAADLLVDAASRLEAVIAKRARELRDAWEDFIEDRLQGDDEDPGTPDVRAPIADSWLRSREAGVDPSGRLPARSVVELNGARAMWDDHPLQRA